MYTTLSKKVHDLVSREKALTFLFVVKLHRFVSFNILLRSNYNYREYYITTLNDFIFILLKIY